MKPIQIDGIVSEDLITRWLNVIDNNRQWWEAREPDVYIYGLAWYYSYGNNLQVRYHRTAMKWNERLWQLPEFSAIMDKIGLSLPRRRLAAPIVPRHKLYGPYWCEAGITLFYSGKSDSDPEYEEYIHTDTDGFTLYPGALFDPETESYSCMLALEVPGGKGGGLYHYPKPCPYKSGIWHIPDDLFGEELYIPPIKELDVYDYRPGTLTIIDSLDLHAIQPWEDIAGRRRVVLTCHFLYRTDPYPHYEWWF
jgi:hypothetical protein